MKRGFIYRIMECRTANC